MRIRAKRILNYVLFFPLVAYSSVIESLIMRASFD